MWVIATGMTCRDIGGIYVDEIKRKEELIKMIENIKDADTIKYLHQTVDKVGVGIYSQHHFSLYNQYFDSFLKI